MAEISFIDAAIDDLRRLGPEVVPKVLRKILMLLDEPEAGYPLGGELTGYRKLIVGRNTWRIVYRITEDKSVEICEVWTVGPRADAEVYAEATARVRAASPSKPYLTKLAEVIERLGRLAGDIDVITEKSREACLVLVVPLACGYDQRKHVSQGVPARQRRPVWAAAVDRGAAR
jgi:mRNA interferase RelE/StbE